VQPGDSLWGIAAGELPAGAAPSEITALWQRWYAVNRQTIGPDPALLFPGQLLQEPVAS
jgi:nucleoid-associated protein YgaU